jgi:hypothetical protein
MLHMKNEGTLLLSTFRGAWQRIGLSGSTRLFGLSGLSGSFGRSLSGNKMRLLQNACQVLAVTELPLPT